MCANTCFTYGDNNYVLAQKMLNNWYKEALDKIMNRRKEMKKNTVTQYQIEGLLKESRLDSTRLGEKTTVVNLTLPNGFVITESSSCVDPANYDHKIGVDCCMDRIKNKIWELEGYLLQEKLYWDAEAAKTNPVDEEPDAHIVELHPDDHLTDDTLDQIAEIARELGIKLVMVRHVLKKPPVDGCNIALGTGPCPGGPEVEDINPSLEDRDPWKHRSAGMKCATCMWFVEKQQTHMINKEDGLPLQLGRCRKNAPAMTGYPAVYSNDWCGEHKLDENK